MTEHNHEHEHSLHFHQHATEKEVAGEFDAASHSLSEALGISFVILKIIMIVLLLVFLASGLRTIDSDEQGIVLRFGRIRGAGEEKILGPGLHWVFPYPVDELIKIPVTKKTNLPINDFWYYQTREETLPGARANVSATLNPVIDGYCITHGEVLSDVTAGAAGSDYHIVHCKWQVTYGIENLERFFRNIYVEDVKPGQDYFEVIKTGITPLLGNMVSDAVVATMVHYSIDEAILSQGRIPDQVKKVLQENLDRIDSGITIFSAQLTDITWPRQVDAAFLESIKASQFSQKIVTEAKGYAENILNEAGGPVASDLLAALKDPDADNERKESLWSQLAGEGQEKIADARAYRTKVVETAKANAEYLEKLLPEYRKRPQLVIQKIYQDAIEEVLNNADEKMIIQPTEGSKSKEVRIMLTRDPALKPKPETNKENAQGGSRQ